jgi:hypothetical protein
MRPLVAPWIASLALAMTVRIRKDRHSGARDSASPESILPIGGYGFRACAKRRIPE